MTIEAALTVGLRISEESIAMRIRLSIVMGILFLAVTSVADESSSPRIEDPKAPLQKIQSLVGGWRGIGQVQRNSSKGAWKETAQWVWDLKRTPPALKISVEDGKHLKTADLWFDVPQQEFVLQGESPDGTKLEYRGRLEKDRLPLIAKTKEGEDRLTLTLLNNKRTTLLFERKAGSASAFQRLAEVGYTREGTRLAVEGVSQRECVVTGGEGTIQVSHNGMKYWVCCTGCVAAFEDDPEGILKDYAARIAERNKK